MDPMTDPEKKLKNLARYLTPNVAKIAREVMRKLPTTLAARLSLVRFLFNDIRGDNLSPEQWQAGLYRFGQWDELKVAVLDARLMPLPAEKLPKSEEELRALCNNLLDRKGDNELREHFVKGWSGEMGLDAALRELCGKVWMTARNDPDFFDAVVRGYHGTAVRYLVHRRVPFGVSRDEAIDLIYHMALIWCAHDVQATAARAHLVMTRPFGWLMFGQAKRMMAATVFAVWRPRYKVLDLHLDRYRTNAEARAGKAEGKLSRHDEVATVKAEVEVSLDPTLLLKVKRSERDAAVEATREFVEITEDGFWDELKNPSGRYDDMQQSEVWYHGLTPLQMVALAVLRLIHAETVLRDRVVTMCEAEKRGEAISPAEFLPHCDQAFPRGWEKRARLLVDDLRRVILMDSDHQTRRDQEEGDYGASKNASHLTAALRFIDEALEEPLPMNPADLKGKRRTLSLLSVAAAARFQR
jgi:hypothetical protein